MKGLLSLVLIFCFSTIIAQDEKNFGFAKGSQFISGAVGYKSSSKPDNSTLKTFTFQPRYAYFVNDFIAIGLSAGIGTETYKNTTGNKITDNNSYTINAFGRYYLLPGNKFSVFAELGLGYGHLKNHIDNSSSNGINAHFSPGLSYFIARNFALEASIGLLSYDRINASYNESTKEEDFQIGIDFGNINLGLLFTF